MMNSKMRGIEKELLSECEYPYRWRKGKSHSTGGDITAKLTDCLNEKFMTVDELPFS